MMGRIGWSIDRLVVVVVGRGFGWVGLERERVGGVEWRMEGGAS